MKFRSLSWVGVLHTTILGLTVFLVTSCTGVSQSDIFKEVDPPTGAVMSTGVWDAMKEAPQDSFYSRSNRFWVLPFYLFSKNFAADKKQEEAFSSSISWFDLGTVILFLPINIKVSEYHYTPDGEEADGRRGLNWNPLWAYAWNDGNFTTEKQYEAKGIPLLFSRVNVGEPESIFARWTTSLWTLGPAVVQVDGKMPIGNEQTPMHGYVGAPLMLGGMLGLAVWTSAYFEVGEDAKVVAQGPFLGTLGFAYSRSRTHIQREGGTGNESDILYQTRIQRIVLGGLLWSDGSRTNTKDEVVSSHHGPIWGMFGWGKKEGRTTVRLFWIPIKL